MSKVKFIPKVIEYDRFQPEFYEDTKTYIKKRSSNKKVKEGIKLYKANKILIDEIEENFFVEKEGQLKTNEFIRKLYDKKPVPFMGQDKFIQI